VPAEAFIAAGEPMECFKPVTVVMRAQALARKESHVGAVAFSLLAKTLTKGIPSCLLGAPYL
jgi:hypothetical protein